MPGPKSRGTTFLGLVLGGALLASESPPAEFPAEPAAEAPPAVTNALPMYVNVRNMMGPDIMPTRCAFVTVGDQKFTFLVPDGFRADVSSDSRVTLVSRDFTSMITVRRAGPEWGAGFAAGAETHHAIIRQHHPEANFTGQLSCSADGQAGPAYNFRWKAGELTRHSRLTVIPTQAGLLEFTLTSSPEQFQAHAGCLDYVLLTFRSGRGGKFEYVQIFMDN